MSSVSSSAYKSAEDIRRAAAKVVANYMQAAAAVQLAQAVAQMIDAYQKQKDSADRMMSITQRQHDRLKNTYWPRELSFLNEWTHKSDPEPVEDMGSRYAGRLVAPVANKYALEIDKLKCNAPKYCTSANETNMESLFMARAVDEATARVQGRQIAFAEHWDKKNLNMDRRMKAIALGANAVGAAASMASQANQIFSAYGQQAFGAFNKALTNFGQAANYQDPRLQFNTFHNTALALSGAQGGLASYGAGATYAAVASGQVPAPLTNNATQGLMDIVQPAAARGTNIGADLGATAMAEKDWMGQEPNNADGQTWSDRVRTGIVTFPAPPWECVVDIDMFMMYKYADDQDVMTIGTVSGQPM